MTLLFSAHYKIATDTKRNKIRIYETPCVRRNSSNLLLWFVCKVSNTFVRTFNLWCRTWTHPEKNKRHIIRICACSERVPVVPIHSVKAGSGRGEFLETPFVIILTVLSEVVQSVAVATRENLSQLERRNTSEYTHYGHRFSGREEPSAEMNDYWYWDSSRAEENPSF